MLLRDHCATMGDDGKLYDVRRFCHPHEEFAEAARLSRTDQPAVKLLARTGDLPLLDAMCDTMLRGFGAGSEPCDIAQRCMRRH